MLSGKEEKRKEKSGRSGSKHKPDLANPKEAPLAYPHYYQICQFELEDEFWDYDSTLILLKQVAKCAKKGETVNWSAIASTFDPPRRGKECQGRFHRVELVIKGQFEGFQRTSSARREKERSSREEGRLLATPGKNKRAREKDEHPRKNKLSRIKDGEMTGGKLHGPIKNDPRAYATPLRATNKQKQREKGKEVEMDRATRNMTTPPKRTSLKKGQRGRPSNQSRLLSSTEDIHTTFHLTEQVSTMTLTECGTYLLAGYIDGTIRLFCTLKDYDPTGKHHSGEVIGHIKAKGLHSVLTLHLEVSKDKQFAFAGVMRGAVELIAFDLTRLPTSKEELRRLKESGKCVSDLLVAYSHLDAKLKGFGASAVLDRGAKEQPTEYRLLCGKGIKSMHLWRFRPPPKRGDSPFFEHLFDIQTNGMTVQLVGFRKGGQEAVSKSDDLNIRIWGIEQMDSETKPNYRDVPNTNDSLAMFGDFAYGGSHALSLVALDAADWANRTEFELPQIERKFGSAPGSSGRKRRSLRVIKEVKGCRGGSHALVTCSDGAVLYYRRTPNSDAQLYPVPVLEALIEDELEPLFQISKVKHSSGRHGLVLIYSSWEESQRDGEIKLESLAKCISHVPNHRLLTQLSSEDEEEEIYQAFGLNQREEHQKSENSESESEEEGLVLDIPERGKKHKKSSAESQSKSETSFKDAQEPSPGKKSPRRKEDRDSTYVANQDSPKTSGWAFKNKEKDIPMVKVQEGKEKGKDKEKFVQKEDRVKDTAQENEFQDGSSSTRGGAFSRKPSKDDKEDEPNPDTDGNDSDDDDDDDEYEEEEEEEDEEERAPKPKKQSGSSTSKQSSTQEQETESSSKRKEGGRPGRRPKHQESERKDEESSRPEKHRVVEVWEGNVKRIKVSDAVVPPPKVPKGLLQRLAAFHSETENFGIPSDSDQASSINDALPRSTAVEAEEAGGNKSVDVPLEHPDLPRLRAEQRRERQAMRERFELEHQRMRELVIRSISRLELEEEVKRANLELSHGCKALWKRIKHTNHGQKLPAPTGRGRGRHSKDEKHAHHFAGAVSLQHVSINHRMKKTVQQYRDMLNDMLKRQKMEAQALAGVQSMMLPYGSAPIVHVPFDDKNLWPELI